ncbi:hypothetical protein [Streptomyces shenzhenensis]|uniref:Uncharacterized protein n=1 Tax=Streptomyces shenzhenensis TaxID=943815 RepID=A0A3M0HZP7_9ACTN|nr:hypothetical protein [Streptomyces shenzhenensis]RMB81282.1 hypothetical protein CTZ28_35350 [Streptomyces shenzhenensis]
MKTGDKIRLRGPNGAPFVVTVGPAFEADYIETMLRTGEWSRIEDADRPPAETTPPAGPQGNAGQAPAETTAPAAPPAKAPDPDRPAVNDPKSDWVAYVARTQHMSREDAANYTKADLIDMVS